MSSKLPDKYYGFDTETIEGYARVVATNTKSRFVSNIDDILEFLAPYRNKILYTYNLRYDSQAIIKWLGFDKCKELWLIGQTNYKDYLFKYIPSKFLSITSFKNSVRFFDIAQFYGYKHLNDVSKLYLNEGKKDYSHYINQCKLYTDNKITLKELKTFFYNNLEDIKRYCQKDAELTLNLAKVMHKTFNNVGMNFNNAFSQAKLSEQLFSKKSYPYPYKKQFFHSLARLSYHGGIFETLKRGVFHNIYNYDINSAYPKVMSTLPNWYNGIFEQFDGEPYRDYEYGWYLCEFDYKWIPYSDFSTPYEFDVIFGKRTVHYKLNQKRIVYPTGLRKQVILKQEYEFMRDAGIKIKIHGGLGWFKVKDTYSMPFSFIPQLYKKRQDLQLKGHDIEEKALKKTLNSLYGKTAQYKNGTGLFTNFYYASVITGMTRLQLLKAVLHKENRIIELATDGIYSLTPLNLPLSNKLGEWKLNVYDKGFWIGSGIKQVWDENGFKTYARGLTNNKNWDLFSTCKRNGVKDKLIFERIRVQQLGETIAHINCLEWEKMNTFRLTQKYLDVNTDKKHVWSRKYKNFNELIEFNSIARPLTIENLT